MRDYYAVSDGPSETKEEQRAKIAADMARFTGEVTQVTAGASAYNFGTVGNGKGAHIDPNQRANEYKDREKERRRRSRAKAKREREK